MYLCQQKWETIFVIFIWQKINQTLLLQSTSNNLGRFLFQPKHSTFWFSVFILFKQTQVEKFVIVHVLVQHSLYWYNIFLSREEKFYLKNSQSFLNLFSKPWSYLTNNFYIWVICSYNLLDNRFLSTCPSGFA